MSTSRAIYWEGIRVKFLIYIPLALDIVDFLSDVVCLGVPSSWSQHIIHLIFQLGTSFFQITIGILMIGHTFTKLFAMVLNMRLFEHFKRNNLRAKGKQFLVKTTKHLITFLSLGLLLNGHLNYFVSFVDF